MRWKVGVLRPGSENIDWMTSGDAESWVMALHAAHRELGDLVARERMRQEYRLDVGGVPMIVWPGINHRSEMMTPRLEELPACNPGWSS